MATQAVKRPPIEWLEAAARSLCEAAECMASPEYEPTFRAHAKLVLAEKAAAVRKLLEGK